MNIIFTNFPLLDSSIDEYREDLYIHSGRKLESQFLIGRRRNEDLKGACFEYLFLIDTASSFYYFVSRISLCISPFCWWKSNVTCRILLVE